MEAKNYGSCRTAIEPWEVKMTIEQAKEAQIQRAQLDKYLKWVHDEGGHEGPVRLDTFMMPKQKDRIYWLSERAEGKILEVGCSWGYVLASLGGHMGVDISPASVQLARILAPGREFRVGDVRDLSFLEDKYDTVLLAEVLEHIPFDDVSKAIDEARKVCRKKILITVPVDENAMNVKHVWATTPARIRELEGMLKKPKTVFENKYFLHIEEEV